MSAELAHQKADKHLCVALIEKCVLGYTLLRNLFAVLQAILNYWQPLLRNKTIKKYQVTPSMDWEYFSRIQIGNYIILSPS